MPATTTKRRQLSSAATSVTLNIPFNSLLASVEQLDTKEKVRLWEALEAQIAQAEEDILEKKPTIKAEIAAAREAYRNGEFVTLAQMTRKRPSRG